MTSTHFDIDHSLFVAKKKNKIIELSFREKPLIHLVDLNEKNTLFDYLDDIAGSDEIRVIILKEAPTKMSRSEYIEFYRSLLKKTNHRIFLERMNNAVGQLVLKLVNLDQLVVHVDSGDVILLFMNIGLACDYRIVADNTVFQNPNIELDTIPKGGGIFFLSKMQGAGVASKMLFSGEDVKAEQACRLGIVDRVVPFEMLDQAAMETAQTLLKMPKGYAAGVKKLFKYNYKELAAFLEFENELLRKKRIMNLTS